MSLRPKINNSVETNTLTDSEFESLLDIYNNDGQSIPENNSENQSSDVAHGRSENEFPFPCPVEGCGKRFRSKRGLTSHKYTHGDRKYYCQICDKVFKSPGGRWQHQKTHPGTKKVPVKKKQPLFPCPICSKTFSRKDNLRRHIRNHGPWTSTDHTGTRVSGNSQGPVNIRDPYIHTPASPPNSSGVVPVRSWIFTLTPPANPGGTNVVYSPHTDFDQTWSKSVWGFPECSSCGRSFKHASNLKRHVENSCESVK